MSRLFRYLVPLLFLLMSETAAALAVSGGDDPLLQKARSGDPAAMLKLADQFFFGKERAPNPVLAAYWFRKAAETGNPRGQYNLGICYKNGWGVPKRAGAAYHWMKRAAAGGEVRAQIACAEMLFDGVAADLGEDYDYSVVPADQETALKILRHLAKKDNLEAQYALAKLLFRDATRNGAELRRLMAHYAETAADPEPEALLLYSAALRSGLGGMPDPELALKLLERCAKMKHPDAMAQLAEALLYGTLGVRDAKRAMTLLEEAIAAGSGRALTLKGDLYFYGWQLENDPVKALECYKLGAKKEHIQAYKKIGDCYLNGIGTEKDVALALKNFEIGAESGDGPAQTALGRLHLHGIGTPVSLTKAFFWFNKAAANGDAEGTYEAGIALLEGRGVPKDTAAGIAMLRRAALMGNRDAQRMISLKAEE